MLCFAMLTVGVDSGHIEDTFKTVGFNNWKKASITYIVSSIHLYVLSQPVFFPR